MSEPITGCPTCSGTGGTASCPDHGPNAWLHQPHAIAYYPPVTTPSWGYAPQRCPICIGARVIVYHDGIPQPGHGLDGAMKCYACGGSGVMWSAVVR